jgi:hypothetical protein
MSFHKHDKHSNKRVVLDAPKTVALKGVAMEAVTLGSECARACVRACVRACMRACVRACVRACDVRGHTEVEDYLVG